MRTLRALAEKLRAGEVTAVETLEAHLARIDAVNGKLNALVSIDAERARQAAMAADNESRFPRGF